MGESAQHTPCARTPLHYPTSYSVATVTVRTLTQPPHVRPCPLRTLSQPFAFFASYLPLFASLNRDQSDRLGREHPRPSPLFACTQILTRPPSRSTAGPPAVPPHCRPFPLVVCRSNNAGNRTIWPHLFLACIALNRGRCCLCLYGSDARALRRLRPICASRRCLSLEREGRRRARGSFTISRVVALEIELVACSTVLGCIYI